MFNQSEIGQRIRAERKQIGMSLEALEEEISTSRQTISKWEKGEGPGPSVYDLVKLCKLFACDFGYLVGEYDCKTRPLTDIHEQTGLSESAINSLLRYRLWGPDMMDLLSLLIASDSFFEALADVIAANEWVHKKVGGPFILSDFYLSGSYEEKEAKGRRDATAFYLQEAQNLFRNAAEQAIKGMEKQKTAPGVDTPGAGAGQNAVGPLPSQDNTNGRE